MNELEFLRSQVRLERVHMRDLRALFSAALQRAVPPALLDGFSQAAGAYLVFALRRFVAQDRMHCERLAARVASASGVDATERARITAALRDLAATLAATDVATRQFAAALERRRAGSLDAPGWFDTCRELDRFYESHLVQRRHQLGPWLESYYDILDWRRSSMVDAESVFEERRLHEAALQAHVALPPA